MTPAADRSEVPVDILAAGLPASIPESLVAGVGATAPGWQVTPYAALTFAAAAVAVTFAAAMWRSERRPGSVALTSLALGAAWWSLLYGLELSSTTLAGTLLFARLAYLGIVVVPISWFAFALAYTGRGHHLRPSTVGVLASPAVLAAALPWTSGESALFWASTSLAYGDPGVLLAVEYGPAFWLWSAYSYVLLGVGTVLLLRSVPLGARLFRRQTALLVVGVAAPLLSNLVYLLRLGGMTLDATPLGFVVSALALGAGLRRYRLLDVHPVARAVARDELVERMSEAVVVLNGEGRIVDVNHPARAVLDLEDQDVVGASLDSAAPDLAAVVDGTDRPDREFTAGDPPRHFEVHVSTLRGNHGRSVGRLVVLHDVTERRRRERHIAVLNRVLRHDLSNDIAVVEGYAELLAANPDNDEYAEVIAERAAEMADLLGKVRNVELALESGSVPLSRVDIVRVIEEQVDGARRAHPEVTFETDLPASEDVYAIDLVHSVVDNLVENAVEHNESDDPYVGVFVGRETECGRPYVTVRVADDGPDIPEPDRRVLVGDEDARLEDASGLGLWLVNWIVSESGGEVAWEPNDPRGNAVVLRLPSAEPGPNARGDGDPIPRRSARGWTHGRRSRPTSTATNPRSLSVRRCATMAGP